MHRRQPRLPDLIARGTEGTARPGTLLVVVPAYNEGANLGRVVADIRRAMPQADVLVVNDGSTDDTCELLPRLGAPWLTLSQRVGVGGAVRAGIRYAMQHGYSHVARVDGDGQHRACDIVRLLAPVASGRADAALGSRFLGRPAGRGLRRLSQSVLATCLSMLTRRRVTDPTSGFWLFGPRALNLLRHHHPGGYAEPELVLLLNRNGLLIVEVPIRMRARLFGRTSLTPLRATLALARTALALLIVPFRRIVVEPAGD
jgi:glycosyltransferase involved in cell wall biosynthesis